MRELENTVEMAPLDIEMKRWGWVVCGRRGEGYD